MARVADQPVSEVLRQIKEWQVARAGLSRDRTALRLRLRPRLDQAGVALLRKLGERRLRQIEQQIATLDAEIAARPGADPAKLHLLTAIIALALAWAARAARTKLGQNAPPRKALGYLAKSCFRTGFDFIRQRQKSDPDNAVTPPA